MGRRRRRGMEGKRQLKAWISEDIYELLQDLAPAIYGRPYGAISYVVEEALKAYLLPRMHTQMHTNPPGRIRRIWDQVAECIREAHGGLLPDQVPAKILHMCIGEVRGSDRRTIEKWVHSFLIVGKIKDLTPHLPPHRKIYEIV